MLICVRFPPKDCGGSLSILTNVYKAITKLQSISLLRCAKLETNIGRGARKPCGEAT